MMATLRHSCFATAVVVAFAASMLPRSAPAQPLTPADQCQVAPLQKWSAQEQWAWRCICNGRIADFDLRASGKIDKRLYPDGAEDRGLCQAAKSEPGERREGANGTEPPPGLDNTISSEFVESLLFSDSFRRVVPKEGVRISGAVFKTPLELSNGQLSNALRIENSKFEKDVRMTGVSSRNEISFSYSQIEGNLVAAAMAIGAFELFATNIRQNLNLVASRIGGSLDMHEAHVGCDLWADLASVDGHVYFTGARLDRIVRLRNAKLAFNLNLLRAQLFRVDVSGSRIQGEINAGYGGETIATRWRDRSPREPAALVLRNTSAAALLGWSTGWPTLRLEGFSYGYIKIDSPRGRSLDWSEWGIDWLGRDRNVPDLERGDIAAEPCPDAKYEWPQFYQEFSFQPYRQYADTIARAGHTKEANDVLFQGRERERELETGGKWLGMTMAKYLIGYGYGYRYFYALGWGLLLIGIGYALIQYTRENEKQDHMVHLGVLYCVDMLLPLIQFRKAHFDIHLQSPLLRGYFLLHRICGYVLGSFIIAGLTGLTK